MDVLKEKELVQLFAHLDVVFYDSCSANVCAESDSSLIPCRKLDVTQILISKLLKSSTTADRLAKMAVFGCGGMLEVREVFCVAFCEIVKIFSSGCF